MESVAETAARCGIPPDKLENLMEHPAICELLVIARDEPDLAPEAIMARLDMPTCDPTGLNFDKLERELHEYRKMATRSSGEQGPVQQRMDYPILRGKLDKAQAQADRYRTMLGGLRRHLELEQYTAEQRVQKVKDVIDQEFGEDFFT
jgi:hypothetical protein